MMCGVGTLVTLDLPDDSPALTLPWIITFGPLDDEEEWGPVVCGPYERSHAMALAESVVADEELMAVVEPLQPHVSVDQIRGDIAAARIAAEDPGSDLDDDEHDHDHDHEYANGGEPDFGEPTPPPSADDVRAGFARIAAKLTGS
jgi:hypothetical protein